MGFFITRNFEIGGQFGYSIINREEAAAFDLDFDFRSTLFSTGIYGQRYFTLSKKIYLTVFTSLTLSSGTDEYIPANHGPMVGYYDLRTTRIFQLSTSIRPTVIFFPLPKFGIQVGVGSIRYLYSANRTTDDKQTDLRLIIGHLPLDWYTILTKNSKG